MQLHGIHHVTAITADARANHHFYTEVLGLRLVKKTVNQDDVSAYHLFYADGEGRPGTELTFFEWPAPPHRRGTMSITRTGLRVGSTGALAFWQARFAALGVAHAPIAPIDGRAALCFEDHEGQRLALFADEGGEGGPPWARSPVPAAHRILGLGPIEMSVPDLAPTAAFLTGLYAMAPARSYTRADGVAVSVFTMDGGGADRELHVALEPHLPRAGAGAGGVHHVAFRARDEAEFAGWMARYAERGLKSSGAVERFYFRSLYVRAPSHVLFEIATDGPGFTVDEPLETLGETLALPPFLAHRRAEIEAGLRPL